MLCGIFSSSKGGGVGGEGTEKPQGLVLAPKSENFRQLCIAVGFFKCMVLYDLY